MKKISELHFRVCDNGLFLPIAQRLAREAGQVSYWVPSTRAFPTVRDRIGEGFPGVQRVECCFDDLESVDCFVFPDIGMSGLQAEALSYGIPVWGSRDGDELELDRGIFLEALKEAGLPLPPHARVRGITKLRELLREKEDVWIKISKFRGDWETVHWRSWAEDENLLDEKAARFGPFREEIVFYVFDPIDAEIEDGCDAYCIGGKFPSLIVHGMEAKDKAFIGAFQRLADLPEEVRQVSAAFGPILGEYDYRGFFSTEVRITDEGESYFIDPTCRAGSPPSQCLTEMIDNYAELIWAGANGEVVDPFPAAKFGVQALCHCGRDADAWTYVKLKGDLERWIKSARACRSGDLLCLPPSHEHTGCEDWLVGIGDTIDEAIRHLKHNVDQLPSGVSCDFLALTELLEEIQAAEEKGMEFTEQPVPDPATVVES